MKRSLTYLAATLAAMLMFVASLASLTQAPATAFAYSAASGSYAGGSIPSVVGGELCNMM